MGKRKVLTDEQLEVIRKRYAAGETAMELSNEYDVAYSTITRLCKGIRTKSTFPKKCIVCGNEFEAESDMRIYCSETCRAKVYNAKRKLNSIGPRFTDCKICGKKFPYQYRRIVCNDCSRKTVTGEKQAVEKQCKVCGQTILSFFDTCTTCRRFEKPKSMKHISELVKEAKSYGMSYGEYIAWLKDGKK